MRVLVIGVDGKARFNHLALDENGVELESHFSGMGLTFEEQIAKIESLTHRYCIDIIVPIVNGWGLALVYELQRGKFANRLWQWPGDMVHEAACDGSFRYGFCITKSFMDVIPHDDSLERCTETEDKLRKIASVIRQAVLSQVCPNQLA